ncbi:MAG TPA: hypothetical protein VN668_14875 [Stellaceae bacterium]|nr:hypothetical protein [Stellaceae bacterium]
MPQKFRLTCARTTYFDVELTAESAAHAERLLPGLLRSDPRIADWGCLGQPVDRIVEISIEEASEGALRDAAA